MLLGALAAACALTAAPSQAQSPVPLSFDGAQLGMTLGAWRSLASPPGVGSTAAPTCSDEPRVARIAHNPLSAEATASGVVACGYDGVYGQYVLPHSIEFDARYRASDPTYLFSGDRLFEIRFEAPIDAYDDVMAWAKSRYGAPTRTTWDRIRVEDRRELQRVRQIWMTPTGEVRVIDPSSALTSLRVELIGDHAAPAGAVAEGPNRSG